MKKLLRILPLVLIALVGSVAITACSDDDDDQIVANTELPTAAQTFISQYFPGTTVVTTTKDKNEYEVTLSDGTRIDFDHSGTWTDVDAVPGKTIPTGFYPTAIDSYVEVNYNSVGINEISKDKGKYDVELVTGVDLVFDNDGSFIRVDR